LTEKHRFWHIIRANVAKNATVPHIDGQSPKKFERPGKIRGRALNLARRKSPKEKGGASTLVSYMGKPFLDNYTGQTTADLLGLRDEYRIDSLVLAFEQAIQSKPETELSEPERFVLAIEAMEREVDNGGWDQFFGNTENEFDDVLVPALNAVGCPGTAELSRDAIEAYRQKVDLEEFDDRYFAGTEPIADRLFEYIASHANEIKLV